MRSCLIESELSSRHTLKSELIWDFTQRRMVVWYRRFGATYRSHLGSSSPRRLTLEDQTDKMSRNVGNKQPFHVAQNPQNAQISFTPRRKPAITRNTQTVLSPF